MASAIIVPQTSDVQRITQATYQHGQTGSQQVNYAAPSKANRVNIPYGMALVWFATTPEENLPPPAPSPVRAV
jgi:hypothetical protein